MRPSRMSALLVMLGVAYGWQSRANYSCLRQRQESSPHRHLTPPLLRSSFAHLKLGAARRDDEHDEPKNFLQRQILATALAVTLLASPAFALDLPSGPRYWSIMNDDGSPAETRLTANAALMDYAVGTINTMFYDTSGGAKFAPRELYNSWRQMKREAEAQILTESATTSKDDTVRLDTRQGVEKSLRKLVASLDDPYSSYLTREELKAELSGSDQHGFLGLGAIVTVPKEDTGIKAERGALKDSKWLLSSQISSLPLVTAVSPDSPAERAGIVVGDRVVAIGDQKLLGLKRAQVMQAVDSGNGPVTDGECACLTIAKPVYGLSPPSVSDYDGGTLSNVAFNADILEDIEETAREILLGYRQTRVKLPTSVYNSGFTPSNSNDIVAGGDNIVHYEMLTSASHSIFDRVYRERSQELPAEADDKNAIVAVANVESAPYPPLAIPEFNKNDDTVLPEKKVGYIRLTRFSKASTAGYLQAVRALEEAGAQSYIIDLRNNYGGVIQEAMLTASTLLKDSHSIICFTMNSRGGFGFHDVEEFSVHERYPGYLLSQEPSTVTLDQVRRENPAMFKDSGIDWMPPSSYASLHEQKVKHGIKRVSQSQSQVYDWDLLDPSVRREFLSRKNIVVLINEGTASSAEVFASALHDNGRLAALVGSKTYGKGIIQHTFPMPDGGGLRLTVAEYLTPSLQHVTKVGNAKYDPQTGELIGGGIRPDRVCESKGIPGNIGADLCVGMALDALEEADSSQADAKMTFESSDQGGALPLVQWAALSLGVLRNPQ